MTQKRNGQLVWNGANIDWHYQTFKSTTEFEIHPHFEITATDPKTKESVTWNDIVLTSEDSSIKGITDFTKLPKELMVGILNNVTTKLYETEPELTRILPEGLK
jgi:hypothetical protein